MSLTQQQELESHYLMPTFGRKPVELVEGKGMYVYDDTGKKYLDFIAGIGVVSLGHCHPALVSALQKQTARLMHVGNYYYIEKRGEIAQSVSDLLNTKASSGAEKQEWKSFFTNSGAEANECAIKLARLAAKRKGKNADTILTMKRSFHGRTLATLAATAQAAKQEAFQPLPAGFVHSPLNDIEALKQLFDSMADSLCAIMLECVQGEGGVHACTPEFLVAVQKLADKHDVLIIVDEIQTGIYRCGTYPFAFQHYDIKPDIVTIAKGIGSGFPVGLCAARADLANAFAPGDHGTTYGGGPLAIEAIKTTLKTLESLDAGAQVERQGSYFRQCLEKIPLCENVRGLGLMCACDLKEPYQAPEVVDKALAQGFLINATGPKTLRFLPPLICTKKDIDTLIAFLSEL